MGWQWLPTEASVPVLKVHKTYEKHHVVLYCTNVHVHRNTRVYCLPVTSLNVHSHTHLYTLATYMLDDYIQIHISTRIQDNAHVQYM